VQTTPSNSLVPFKIQITFTHVLVARPSIFTIHYTLYTCWLHVLDLISQAKELGQAYTELRAMRPLLFLATDKLLDEPTTDLRPSTVRFSLSYVAGI
jgi:hypothetical protein